MKLTEQVNMLRRALEPWAREHQGSVAIAADPWHVWDLLAAKPGSVRIVIWPESGSKRGEHEEASMEDRTFKIIVSRGRGLQLDRAAAAAEATAHQPALWDIVEQARDVLRGLSLDPETTEVTLDYHGWEPLEAPNQQPLDAYAITVSIGTLLPAGQQEPKE